jgi:hypothetical protein
MLKAMSGLLVEVDEYKNDVHCLGIVFLYISVPEIKLLAINELIFS